MPKKQQPKQAGKPKPTPKKTVPTYGYNDGLGK